MNDSQLIAFYNSQRESTHKSPLDDHSKSFSLESLVGLQIQGVRRLDTGGDNPRYITVVDIGVKAKILIGYEGLEDMSTIHVFYIDGNENSSYSTGFKLFDIDHARAMNEAKLRPPFCGEY